MNPILQMLNQTRPNNLLSIIRAVKSNDPNVMFSQLMASNPQFAQLVNENRGLSPEQVAQKYGINLNEITQLLK